MNIHSISTLLGSLREDHLVMDYLENLEPLSTFLIIYSGAPVVSTQPFVLSP